MYPRLVLNYVAKDEIEFRGSCLRLLALGLRDMQHHTWLGEGHRWNSGRSAATHVYQARRGADTSWILMLLFRELEHWVMGTEEGQPVWRGTSEPW